MADTDHLIHINIHALSAGLSGKSNGDIHSYVFKFCPKYDNEDKPDTRANEELELLTEAVLQALERSILKDRDIIATRICVKEVGLNEWPAITLTFEQAPSKTDIRYIEQEIAKVVEAEYKHIALQMHGGHEAPGTEILPSEPSDDSIVSPTLCFTGPFGETTISPTDILSAPGEAYDDHAPTDVLAGSGPTGYATNAGKSALRVADVEEALKGRGGSKPGASGAKNVRVMQAVVVSGAEDNPYEAAPETVKMEALSASPSDIVSAVFQAVLDNLAGAEIHDASTLKENIASDAIVAAATIAVKPKVGGDLTAARLDVVAVINAMRKFVDSNSIADASGIKRMLGDAGAKGFIARQLEKARASRQRGAQR